MITIITEVIPRPIAPLAKRFMEVYLAFFDSHHEILGISPLLQGQYNKKLTIIFSFDYRDKSMISAKAFLLGTYHCFRRRYCPGVTPYCSLNCRAKALGLGKAKRFDKREMGVE